MLTDCQRKMIKTLEKKNRLYTFRQLTCRRRLNQSQKAQYLTQPYKNCEEGATGVEKIKIHALRTKVGIRWWSLTRLLI